MGVMKNAISHSDRPPESAILAGEFADLSEGGF
jgi:hypothetical protein